MVVLGGRVSPRHRGQASLRGPFGYLGARQLGALRDQLGSYLSPPCGQRVSGPPAEPGAGPETSHELRRPSQLLRLSISPENTVPDRAGEKGKEDPASRPSEPPVLHKTELKRNGVLFELTHSLHLLSPTTLGRPAMRKRHVPGSTCAFDED